MWQRSRRWSRFPGPAKADQGSELGAPGGRLELFQRLRPRAGNRTGGMGGAGLGGVCVFQDLGFLPPFLLWAWAEIPEGSGVGGVRYLGISGRAPGGSHLPSYLGLGRGEEGGWRGRTQGVLQGASQGLPRPCFTLFTDGAETSLLESVRPAVCLVGGSYSSRTVLPPSPHPATRSLGAPAEGLAFETTSRVQAFQAGHA